MAKKKRKHNVLWKRNGEIFLIDVIMAACYYKLCCFCTFEINLQALASQAESERAFWIAEECLLNVTAGHTDGVWC